jgi:hypothetical protein
LKKNKPLLSHDHLSEDDLAQFKLTKADLSQLRATSPELYQQALRFMMDDLAFRQQQTNRESIGGSDSNHGHIANAQIHSISSAQPMAGSKTANGSLVLLRQLFGSLCLVFAAICIIAIHQKIIIVKENENEYVIDIIALFMLFGILAFFPEKRVDSDEDNYNNQS